MSIPGVPSGLRRQILAAFINRLQTAPLLGNNRAVKTWLVWDGKTPVADPTTDAMPAVQVRLIGGPVKRLASTRVPGHPMTYANESHPSILIDAWVAGNDQGDLADLADLIYRSLAPQDDSERSLLERQFRDAGIKDWQLSREILPMSAEGFSLEQIMGSGSYELTLHFNS